MATLKGFIAPLVTKQSGGKTFLASPPSFAKIRGGKIPDKVKARNDVFTAAVSSCSGQSKKRPDVFAQSDFNKCVKRQLGG